MSRPSLARRLLLSAAIVIGLLALSEFGLRLAHFDYPPAEFPILIWNKEEDRLMDEEDYLFEPDTYALWGLRPAARIQFGEAEAIDGPPEYVNAAGYRGPLLPHEKTSGVLRIVTLGDSSTYGLGVQYAQTYSAQLEGLLNARRTRAEVIDGGVDGYTLRQGIERYRHLARPYRPDVVIAAFGAVNEHWAALDLDDEAKIQLSIARSTGLRSVRRWIRGHSRLTQAIAWLIDPKAFKRAWQVGEKQRDAQMSIAEFDAQEDWPGRRRVSLELFSKLLTELDEEVTADGARLILIAMPRRLAADHEIPVLRHYTQALLDVARSGRIQLLYALGRFRELEKAGSLNAELFIHDHWHPSAAGHRRIAEWLAPMIEDPSLHLGNDGAFPRR